MDTRRVIMDTDESDTVRRSGSRASQVRHLRMRLRGTV